MAIHILGIRHHGVGSAKHVRAELERLQPDLVLVEGPPEITEVLATVGHKDLKPPVSLMVYNPDQPSESTFYPFAEYSPEWVAIQYANQQGIPVRAMDLPAVFQFRMQRLAKEKAEAAAASEEPKEEEFLLPPNQDPLTVLGKTLGYPSGEAWWEYHFEHTEGNSEEHFASVMHVMQNLREAGMISHLDEENVPREAYMRQILQEALQELYQNIVVVCGAWHAPALVDLERHAKEDAKVLKKLPKKGKINLTSTWIPWTNGRLSYASGYGAGITSPGWYQHQWAGHEQPEIRWLQRVAATFRAEGQDTSTAHVLETFRLARSLAILRDRYYVGLEEMEDAILSVMCMGDPIRLELIHEQLVVGEALGTVPDDLPKVPLQEDFERQVKTLRLKLTASAKQLDLDLRKPTDLGRSVLFHRLELLNIPWASPTHSRTKGTFKESWKLKWSPQIMLALIEQAYLGNTLEVAASEVVLRKSQETEKIRDLSELVEGCLPAELFEPLARLLKRIQDLSTISVDVLDLMLALPRLVNLARYGDVRQTDLRVVSEVVDQLMIKVLVGLPTASYGLDEANSTKMFEAIAELHTAIRLYQNGDLEADWYLALHKTINKEGVHPIIQGCVCRLLLDSDQFSPEETDARISRALSATQEPKDVAAWLEGFLRGSGMILIYDHRLWNLLYAWVESLEREVFGELLPLLRRAFSKFEYAERRQIGNKARHGYMEERQQEGDVTADNFDEASAAMVLPTLSKLMGL